MNPILFTIVSLPVFFRMAPKKREKELDKNRMDHAQADHELFLQAFESKFVLGNIMAYWHSYHIFHTIPIVLKYLKKYIKYLY